MPIFAGNTMERDKHQLLDKAYNHFNKQEFGEAINSLNKLLEIEKDHKEAIALKDQIVRILKFSNTDIYSCTNLFMDPWEE